MRSIDRKPLNMGIAGVEPRHQGLSIRSNVPGGALVVGPQSSMDATIELLSSKARSTFGHGNNECEFSFWHSIEHFARTMWHCPLLPTMSWTDRYCVYVRTDVVDKSACVRDNERVRE
jgi:hypothetical protein